MEPQDFNSYLNFTKEIGEISYYSYPIAYITGLPSLRIGEGVITEDGEQGIVFDIGRIRSEILMVESEKVGIGKKIVRTDSSFKIPISYGLLGRIIDPLCKPLDRLGPITGKKEYLPILQDAPQITKRVRVTNPLQTGVMIVDMLVPLGHGQRETVIGDSKTGKTQFILQALSHQASLGTIGIYVGIAKEIPSLKIVENYLKQMGYFDKIIMLITTASQSQALHYLAPFSGMAIAEYFRDQGHKVLICFDDLSAHAKVYREISLLFKRTPGREAYPGDIFHLHAALLERAGNIRLENTKEASITALPVVETLENDISGFVQTNILAMTDGHIFFDSTELKRGRLPPINAFLSVSRVGNQTRSKLQKDLVDKIKRKLIEYRKILEVARFGSELSKESQEILEFGEKIETLFLQESKILIPQTVQFFLFGLLFAGFWKNVSGKVMRQEIEKIINKFKESAELQKIEERMQKVNNSEELINLCKEFIPTLERLI